MIKSIARYLLLCFVAFSLGYLVASERTHSVDPIKPPPPPQEEAPRVIVYYFHGNVRCKTCNAIEAYSREPLQAISAKSRKSTLQSPLWSNGEAV